MKPSREDLHTCFGIVVLTISWIAMVVLPGCETIGYLRERHKPVKVPDGYTVYGPGDQVAYYSADGRLLMLSNQAQR